MSEGLVSRLPDADMQAATATLLRAAERAEDLARRTGTALVVVRDGKLIEEPVDAADRVAEQPDPGSEA